MIQTYGKRARGRPRRMPDECACARVWAYLTPSERVELQRVAAENGIAVAEVIREAVNVYVADYCERRVIFQH